MLCGVFGVLTYVLSCVRDSQVLTQTGEPLPPVLVRRLLLIASLFHHGIFQEPEPTFANMYHFALSPESYN